MYSEREYTLLHFAVQLLYYHYSHPPKKMKLPQKVKFEAKFWSKNHDVGGHHQQKLFSHQKKVLPSPHSFLTTNKHFCHELFV